MTQATDLGRGSEKMGTDISSNVFDPFDCISAKS